MNFPNNIPLNKHVYLMLFVTTLKSQIFLESYRRSHKSILTTDIKIGHQDWFMHSIEFPFCRAKKAIRYALPCTKDLADYSPYRLQVSNPSPSPENHNTIITSVIESKPWNHGNVCVHGPSRICVPSTRYMASIGGWISIHPINSYTIPYLVLVWSKTEMLESLSGVLWSSKEKSVASGWGSEGQLIDGQSLTTGSKDASTGSGSEAESRNTELGNLQ